MSAQSLGGGDGWLEFTVGDGAPYRVVGLARPHAGTSGGAIEFAFRAAGGTRRHLRKRRVASRQPGSDRRYAAHRRRRRHRHLLEEWQRGLHRAATPQYPLAATAALVDAGAAVDGARLGLEAATPTGTTFVSGVMAQPTAAGTGATVSWTTNVATDGQVQYGTAASYGSWSLYAAAASTMHAIDLADSRRARPTIIACAPRTRAATPSTRRTRPSPRRRSTDAPNPTANAHRRLCGWLQANGYVPLEQDPGYLAFVAHASDFDAVHPMWYYLSSTTTFKAAYGEGSPLVLANTTAGGKRTLLIPTIAAADGAQPQWASQMIHDATLRAQHEAAIVSLVTSKGYDGIDLDYEHLPDADKAAFSTFATELAAQLHAKGKTLSFAVGGLVNAKYSHWDYNALSAAADQLHVMGYDYPLPRLASGAGGAARLDPAGARVYQHRRWRRARWQVHPRAAQLRPRRRRQWRHHLVRQLDGRHQPRRRQLRDDDDAHGELPDDQRRDHRRRAVRPTAPRRRGTSSSTIWRRTKRRWRRRKQQGSRESPIGPSAASPIGPGRRPSFR